jgi:hypothetical protein
VHAYFDPNSTSYSGFISFAERVFQKEVELRALLKGSDPFFPLTTSLSKQAASFHSLKILLNGFIEVVVFDS